MLTNGGGQIIWEWDVTVREGRFTFPKNLGTPIKYKIGQTANSGFGPIHSPYQTYSSQGVRTFVGFSDWDERQISVRPNPVSTQFHPPLAGVRLMYTTRDERDVGKKIIVNGDRCGKALAPLHQAYKTSGEQLTLYHESDPHKKYGAWVLDTIRSVVRDQTCSYAMLSGISDKGQIYFLEHYHPDEEVPVYTEGFLNTSGGFYSECDWQLSILGRINPSIRYIRDEDVLPITSVGILRFLAKRAKYDEQGDFNEVATMELRIREAIKKHVAYQQEASRQLSVNLEASGMTLTNI